MSSGDEFQVLHHAAMRTTPGAALVPGVMMVFVYSFPCRMLAYPFAQCVQALTRAVGSRGEVRRAQALGAVCLLLETHEASESPESASFLDRLVKAGFIDAMIQVVQSCTSDAGLFKRCITTLWTVCRLALKRGGRQSVRAPCCILTAPPLLWLSSHRPIPSLFPLFPSL